MHSLAGCYSSGFPETELREPEEETDDPSGETIADAGPKAALRPDTGAGAVDASARDAGPTDRCTGADPIALLLCNLTRPAAAAQPASPVETLTTLLNGLGGLNNIAQVLGSFLGTPQPSSPTATSGLSQLINLAGGLANIAQLLNGVVGQAQPGNPLAPWAQLFGRGATPATQPSLADILRGLGIPTLGPVMPAEPTTDQCTAPTNPVTQFICLLQQANSRGR